MHLVILHLILLKKVECLKLFYKYSIILFNFIIDKMT